MATPTKGNIAGHGYVQLCTLNSDGYPTGTAGKSPANNTTSHAHRVIGAIDSSFNPVWPTEVNFMDGDKPLGRMLFGGLQQGQFDIQLDAVIDGTLMALVNGANLNNSDNSRMYGISPNSQGFDFLDFGLLISQPFQSLAQASRGTAWWFNYWFPVVKARLALGGLVSRGKKNNILRIVPSVGARLPWGGLFGTNQGVADNETDMYCYIAPNPLALTTYVGDGSTTSFTTAYRLAGTTITINAGFTNYAENGTLEALTSATLAGVITPDAAPAAATIAVLAYETDKFKLVA